MSPHLSSRRRAGFTLVELLIGLVLFGIVGLAAYRMLTGTQRLSQMQAEQVNLQANIRTGAAMVPEELREVAASATSSDIVAISDTSIQYRALRGFGVLCGVTATAVKVRADSFYYAYRAPQAGRDALLIFAEGANPSSSADDSWVLAPVTGAMTTDNSCGVPTFVIPATVGAGNLAGIATGAPVRNTEVMSLELYTSGGQRWLGARSVSGGETSPQPVIGPLKPRGFQLTYYTGNGTVTTNPLLVRDIKVTLRGLTASAVHSGGTGSGTGQAEDSLITRIRLRNSPAL